LELIVEGSTGNEYVVHFERDGELLHTSCTCSAGQNRMHCKHRLELMDGSLGRLVTTEHGAVREQIAEMLRGTNVEQALRNFREAEDFDKAARAQLKEAKKALDRALHQ
jgi:hypothetical protein